MKLVIHGIKFPVEHCGHFDLEITVNIVLREIINQNDYPDREKDRQIQKNGRQNIGKFPSRLVNSGNIRNNPNRDYRHGYPGDNVDCLGQYNPRIFFN